ncbi:MAG: type I-C CRISPR-associated endonuclease Cas1c, partial [Tissierellia bacterium]|nr:type I-C CRISPR-associated endonuclease Cas1c [Tissierellia bacterium]
MKKLLNTLYITQEDMRLSRDGSNVVIWKEEEKLKQIPIQYLENIVCFSYVGISSSLMELSTENNVSISFLSPWGKYRGRVEGPIKGNVLLRKEQYRISENEEASLFYAQTFMFGKIYNSTKILQRAIRDYKDLEDIDKMTEAIGNLKTSKKEVFQCEHLESLLGVEGDASRNYFQNFPHLIRNKEFEFTSRTRRPPKDPMNAMLSFGYGMLRVRMEWALETVGLDPYVGFYHQDRPGRSSLALDLMEELRAYIVDRFVLSIVNLKQISEADFMFQENGSVLFTEDGMKVFLDLWNKKQQEELKHPFLEEQVKIGLLPYVQAMLLARTIRGDLEIYPP